MDRIGLEAVACRALATVVLASAPGSSFQKWLDVHNYQLEEIFLCLESLDLIRKVLIRILDCVSLGLKKSPSHI